MPVVDYSISGRKNLDEFIGETVLVTWLGLAVTDTGHPLQYGALADRSVQFGGTFGAAGIAVLEGSNDGVNYHTLTNPQGEVISATAAALFTVDEVTRFVRPRVTGGDGTTAIDVHLFARAPQV